MGSWLDPVREALDRRASPATMFIRDDDAGWDDAALARLLERCAAHDIAIDLAAIPCAVSDALAHQLLARISAGERIGIHQHGYRHANHQESGRKCEFGDARSRGQQHLDIATGRARLRVLFGDRLDAIFTPPWNRCTQDTADALVDLGFSVLSRDLTATTLDTAGLTQLPVAVDWSKWMRADAGPARLAQQMVAALDGDMPFGIMLHHADMDVPDLDRLESLLALLAGHRNLSSVLMRQCAWAPTEAAA